MTCNTFAWISLDVRFRNLSHFQQFKVQAVLNAKHNAALEERDLVIADLGNKLLEAQVKYYMFFRQYVKAS